MKDMHKLNIMHRDIKMKNILMHDNKIKLGDLGFSIKIIIFYAFSSTKNHWLYQ
jgi:serine/threonine protein kinase